MTQPSRRTRPTRRRPRTTSAGRPPRLDEAAQQRRRSLLPAIEYPPQLPVVAERVRIRAAIEAHQVVVVAGETGSGKTTQLPKILLEMGRGIAGMIGHTQPRRIAARSVADRIADELHVPLGGVVGYQVRFADHSGPDSLVKVMTDGILLSELRRDRDLRRYDTLIIDEAHERSLNIDFILGYLKQLLPRRPDLKVIVTSATIDPGRFAEHFAQHGVPAPVIEVSGRTFPVEVRYRPLVEEIAGPSGPQLVDVDQVTGIVRAVEELWSEPVSDGGPQDILVFCSGEREIRDAAEALDALDLPGTATLPLYARLSAAEQHRVFGSHGGRRIVIATNVAETSLTVPGIRYVVDSGTARISRYSQRTKVQRLPIEPVSQASARQRSGRCGRVADGVCIRLYSEEDFLARPEFTDPEILRTNLASVILQMASLDLGDVARFPFVEPPDSRQISDGVRLLEELQAVEERGSRGTPRLTAAGRAISALPTDPRLARMLLAGAENGALAEVLVIVAALSIQDPRERPAEKRPQADQSHARFRHETSDFLSLLNLWRYLKEQQKALSSSAFRRMCQREYLHYLRVREWQDLHTQLREACKQQGMRRADTPAGEDAVHQAMLTGLLSHVGLRDREKRDFLGARGVRFAIQPGSALFRKPPDWVMSAELVETSRLWARTNAAVDPAWVERAGGHLVKRSYAEPHWERRRGSVVAAERVTLYGLPLAAGRKVDYGSIDPVMSRDLFIRSALVEGDWESRHAFTERNRQTLARLRDLEARTRRRDVVVDDETVYAFYDAKIPESIVSAAHFDAWWKKEQRSSPDLLTMSEDDLRGDDAADIDLDEYPRTWSSGELDLRLSYRFEPGSGDDGVTVHVPVEQLNQVDQDGFDWLVPGVRGELVTALIRSLPKAMRRNFVPAPDVAARALPLMDPARGSITTELAGALQQLTGVRVPADQWDWDRVPNHLKATFRVEDSRRRALSHGEDLSALREQLSGRVRSVLSRAGSEIERSGLTTWDFEELPAELAERVGKRTVQGYPALVDEGDSVALRVLPSAAERDAEHPAGVRRLLLLQLDVPWSRLLGMLDNAQRLALGWGPHADQQAVLSDVLAAAVDAVVAADSSPGPVRTRERFDAVLRQTRQQASAQVLSIVEGLVPVLHHSREVQLALDSMIRPSVAELVADVRRQHQGLVYPGFIAATGASRLRDLDRYLRGMLERLERAPEDIARDAQRMDEVHAVERELGDLIEGLPPARRREDAVRRLRWQVQELRISFFAQRLGTSGAVSVQRLRKAMDRIEAAPTT
ncbi:ATP-dependent RNA helicase HrpA [Allobranchiibius sp. GilTou38]|uniref:ATP-dependent RNA helicase HrpA n=1 Tax=Allobranchiibius sp. GilTou38 TaxID=2815210 RepID=UPI001AA14DD4|nr:ATP-dependent RNA helicase HrpA [Allobranchiibius sp. GilTou38]MBO1766971.1 ATP-dependent RNA helicase HrpA [Allobranchiibius sp. GilTou38]